ncbi:Major facilitator [Parasponia andersonii]|uniref:Major facilitator n=1 Tax=Parasponia andersonii TaxID=3476 RepID=A0A2P5CJ35_PARAD|nr:Major facilitator [Parasponia andersonii]
MDHHNRRLSPMSNNKWVTTAASIWIQCAAGASYTFSIYSSVLKSSQGYDQSTLDTVSVFKDIGANTGVLSGLLYDAVTTQRRRSSIPGKLSGPWVVHTVGAVLSFVGYFFMWAAVTGLIPRPPVMAMCLLMFSAAHAQVFLNTANVVSGVHNFSAYSGTIVGILKGFLGLSGAILVQFYDTICRDKPSTFLLVLALFPTLISVLLMSLVRIHETNTRDDNKYLNAFSLVALIIAAYLTIIILLENILTLSTWSRISTFLLLLLLLASPLGIAIKAQYEDLKGAPEAETSSNIESNPLLDNSNYPSTSSKFSAQENPFEYEELPTSDRGQVKLLKSDDTMLLDEEVDMNLLQAMGTINFWLLFFAMFCGMGSGLATINNMNQLGHSLGYTTLEITSFVSLWSIWNFLGRLGAGYLSDFFLHTRGWARPLFIAITLGSMAIGHIIIASGFSENLYVGSILVGICYGSQWSLMPTISKEIFGIRHMGTIFNTISMASPIGSYIFSVRVIGYIYDKEASGNTCIGTHCFMTSFFIVAAVDCFGCLVAITLFFRTRRFYQLVVLKRLRYS